MILHQLQIHSPLSADFEGRQTPCLYQTVYGRPGDTEIRGQLLQRHNFDARNVLHLWNL